MRDYNSRETTIFPGFTTLSEYKSRPSQGGMDPAVMIWDMLPYLKLIWMRDRGGTEVGGYAVTKPEDPLHVVDFYLVNQECNSAFCKFDDLGVADYIADMAMGIKTGRPVLPDNSCAIWVHTHPGSSASPSGTDYQTFQSPAFNGRPWAVMFIIARQGEVSSRLRYNVGPLKDMPAVPVVDMNSWNPSRDLLKCAILHKEWEVEYKQLVHANPGVRVHGHEPTRYQRMTPIGEEQDNPGMYNLKGDGSSNLSNRTGQYSDWDINSRPKLKDVKGYLNNLADPDDLTLDEYPEDKEVESMLIDNTDEINLAIHAEDMELAEMEAEFAESLDKVEEPTEAEVPLAPH